MSKNLITTSRNKVKDWIYYSNSTSIAEVLQDIADYRNNQISLKDFATKYKEVDKSGNNLKSQNSLNAIIRRTYNELKKSRDPKDKQIAIEIKKAYDTQYIPIPPTQNDIWDYLAFHTLPYPLPFRKQLFINGIYYDCNYNEAFAFPNTYKWAFTFDGKLKAFEKDMKKLGWIKHLIHLYRVTFKYTYEYNQTIYESYISTKTLKTGSLSVAIIKLLDSLVHSGKHDPFNPQTDITSPTIDDIRYDNAKKILEITELKVDCYLKQNAVAKLKYTGSL